jgi:hypothetical protein
MKTMHTHSHRGRRFLAGLAALTLLGGGAFGQVAAPAAPSAALAPKAAAPAPSALEDIRDIRGPISIPAPLRWAEWIGLGLLAAGAGYGVWRWMRRTPARTPFELALARLESARALMQPGHAEAFSNEVSETVREYIEWRFQARAAHLTTEEFFAELLQSEAGPLAEHREPLVEFLTLCDLAKFARWSLLTPDMEAMLESARSFILAARPVKENISKNKASERAAKPAAAPWNRHNHATL